MKLIFFLFLIFFCYTEEINFIDYGIYCGYMHTSEYGIKPIDIADRYCQIHDICTSLGLFNCYCNEQLYYYYSNYIPVSNETKYEKDSILKALYAAIFMCPNYENFEGLFKIPGNNIKGFNYLPLFYYKKNTYLRIENYFDMEVYKFDDYDSYIKFAYLIHDKLPDNNNKYYSNLIKILNNEIYVLYNNKTFPIDIIINNISDEMNIKYLINLKENYEFIILIIILLNCFIILLFGFYIIFSIICFLKMCRSNAKKKYVSIN